MKCKVMKPIIESGKRYLSGDDIELSLERAKALGDVVKCEIKKSKKSHNKAILETKK